MTNTWLAAQPGGIVKAQRGLAAALSSKKRRMLQQWDLADSPPPSSPCLRRQRLADKAVVGTLS
jgi:hypothetical protein